MSVTSYADASDYANWTTKTAPDDIVPRLRSASLMVAEATIGAYYTVDAATLLPTDTATLEALRDATCAQADALIALGADPNLAGTDVKAPTRGKGIGSARVDYDTSAQSSSAALAARQAVVGQLCPDAVRILRAAGLLTVQPWVFG